MDVCCYWNNEICHRVMKNVIGVFDLFYDDSMNDYDVVCLFDVCVFEALKN